MCAWLNYELAVMVTMVPRLQGRAWRGRHCCSGSPLTWTTCRQVPSRSGRQQSLTECPCPSHLVPSVCSMSRPATLQSGHRQSLQTNIKDMSFSNHCTTIPASYGRFLHFIALLYSTSSIVDDKSHLQYGNLFYFYILILVSCLKYKLL